MDDYIAVRVSTLRGDLKIPFNAFVRVAGKYILYCREGDSFEGTRLERLKAKNLLKMYIPKEQAASYDEYIRENINRAYGHNKNRPVEIRAQIIHGALQASAEDLMEDPSSNALYAVAVDGANKFVKFFFTEPDCLKSLLEIKNVDFNIAHHSVVVAALSLAIAEEMKYTETKPMQMPSLTVGSLIHDIEHNYNNLDMSLNPDKLTKTEKIIYNKHAANGAERIRNQPFYDPLIANIISQHDEKIDGTGPRKVKEKDLDPLSMVVATANQFEHLLSYENLSVKDALKKILIDKMGILSLDTMKALQGALKARNII